MSYEVHQRPAAQDDPPPPTSDEPWQVVLEFSNRGDAKPPTKLMSGRTGTTTAAPRMP